MEIDQTHRIGSSSLSLHSLTAPLSSSFDSGVHDVLLFSVIGYNYNRDYTAGVSEREVAKINRVI